MPLPASLFFPEEKACIEEMIASLMVETAEVRHRQEVRDRGGGLKFTYPAVPDALVPTLVYQIPGSLILTRAEREQNERVLQVGYWQMMMPNDADIRETDRITVDGRVFEVVTTDAPNTIDVALVVTAVLVGPQSGQVI